MKEAYISAFHEVVVETIDSTGFDLPTEITSYIIMLLASRVEQNPLPDPNFAIAFLNLSRPADQKAKELGDTCLFVSSVYPKFGEHRGLNRRYYQDIGSTSYDLFAEKHNPELFNPLSRHFAYVSNFISLVVSSPKLPPNILFQ